MSRIYLDKTNARIERTDLYLVRLTLQDGAVLDGLEPRMLFPHTNPTMYITLLDQKEKEIAFICDLNDIDSGSRLAIEECFKEYYMVPKIIRVLDCEDKFGKLKWHVETDRGEITFTIKNRHSDIKHIHGSPRIIIRDSNDNRYEITSTQDLDAKSLRMLFAYL